MRTPTDKLLGVRLSHGDRDFWGPAADTFRKLKEHMQPLLKGWLIPAIKGICF
jgi:nuclear pore complex protein Nup107